MKNRAWLSIAGFGVLLLFWVQLTGVLIEAIYILNLLQTSLNENALGLLFLFSPVLLLPFGRRIPNWLLWLSCAVLFAARGLVPYLDTSERMLAAGLGCAGILLLLPGLLSRSTGEPEAQRGLVIGQGFALAVSLAVLLRALGFGLDYSLESSGGWLGWLLGLLPGALLWQSRAGRENESGSFENPDLLPQPPSLKKQGEISGILGIFAVFTLVYFVFASPGVLARWTEGSYPLIVTLVSGMALGWLLVSLANPALALQRSPRRLLLANSLFVLALVTTILAHIIRFPASPQSAPVVVGAPAWWQQIPLYALLLLFPIIFVNASAAAGALRSRVRSGGQLAPGFLLGSLILVVLVFMLIFTNVWGYVAPVSTPFRNLYWLPFLLAGLLLLWASQRQADQLKEVLAERTPVLLPAPVLLPVLLLGLVFGGTLAAALLGEQTKPSPAGGNSLRVMTYNIQQANTADGEKSYRQQLALIEQVNPDVLVLQESDSARISLNNNDYVRYFASKLGYHSYYGPKTVAGTYGTAILSRYPLENTHSVFTFSDQDETGTAVAEIMVGNRRIAIFNVHPDGSDTAMLAFASTLVERAGAFEHVIALGDYNLRGDEEGYLIVDAVYVNAWMSTYPSGVSPDGTDMSGRNRIDHIFVSENFNVVNPIYVLPPDSWTDHPVHWTDLTWED